MMNRLEDLYPHVLGHKSSIQATYDIARLAIERGVPGDFVECGVYAGAQCAAMARALLDSNWFNWQVEGRRVHLFDSFAGFPSIGEYDGDLRAVGTKPGGSACSLEDVKANMQRWRVPDELLVYWDGPFVTTMPMAVGFGSVEPDECAEELQTIRPKNIAVLRLDGDLYESTKVCLQYLYPQVSPGGWVILDDYNLDGCRKAFGEYFDKREKPAPICWRIPK